MSRRGDAIEKLSLGNQQRVQLAAALMHDPELLVLDEPFAGLDPGGVDDMTEILAERARAGVTVLFSSHQLDLVEHICEAVAIIHRGRVVAQGAVSDLERGDRARLAVRVAGDPGGDWARQLDPGIASVERVDAGLVLLVLAPDADSQKVLDTARAAGPVEHFSFASRRLSEVFRDVTGEVLGHTIGALLDGIPESAAIGVSLAGEKDVLGLWVGTGGEGAKFWMAVLTDLHAGVVHAGEPVVARWVAAAMSVSTPMALRLWAGRLSHSAWKKFARSRDG